MHSSSMTTSVANTSTVPVRQPKETPMSMTLVEIDGVLKQLRLAGMRATLETRLLESQASNLSVLEAFSALLQDELDQRQSHLLQRRYQLSGLDERLTLTDFDWSYNPEIPKRTC